MTLGAILQQRIRQSPVEVLPAQYGVSLLLCLVFVPFQPLRFEAVVGFVAGALAGAGDFGGGAAAAGELRIAARAGKAAAGKAGNAYTIQLIALGAAGSPTCTINLTTKAIVVSAHATDTAQLVSSKCNINADFAGLFVADAETAGALTGWANDAAQAMTGGQDKFTFTVTMSEELGAANAGQFAISGLTCTEAITANTATNNGNLTGVLEITCTAPEAITAGVNTLTVSAAGTTIDRNGNQVDTTGNKNVVAIFAG